MENINDNKKYSRLLSSLFCAVAVMGLTFLCLLNSMPFDFYSAVMIFKTVVPCAVIANLVGFAIGKILDNGAIKAEIKQEIENKKAYDIPSMFLDGAENTSSMDNDDFLS